MCIAKAQMIFGMVLKISGPRLEKTCLRGFVNNTGADQPAHPQSDQRLCYSLFGKFPM